MGKEKSNPVKSFFTTILAIALGCGLLFLILKGLLWIISVIFGVYIIYRVATYFSKQKPEHESTYISYKEIRDNYYNLCKFYFKLDFEEKEDLEKNNPFILIWKVHYAYAFTSIIDEIDKSYNFSEIIQHSIFSLPITISLKYDTNFLYSMIKDSRKPEKNLVTFSTIEDRENYLNLLKQSIESLIIFSIHKTYSPNNIKKFKYDFLELGKYTDLLSLIQSGEEYNSSLETSKYTVEHFMPKAGRQNGVFKYEYFFRVVFNDDLAAQRIKLKMDSFLKTNNSKNNLENSNQLISKNYYFSVPGDSIMMMIRVNNALRESIESQETTIRGYIKAGVKRNVNKLRRID